MEGNKKGTSSTHNEKLRQTMVSKDEQPYKVPENWEWVKFAVLASEIADGPFGSNLKQEHYTLNHEVRIIQLGNIGDNGWRDQNTKYTTFEHAKTISRSIVKPGNIAVAKMMPAGRAIIVPDQEKMYVLSSDVIKVVPRDIIDTRFMLNGINSAFFRNQVQGNTQGITRSRTSIGKLKEYAFPIPPLAEQYRIVERVESLFAKLDTAKELVQSTLDSFETRKAAILHKAFTGELSAKWREENGVGMESWSIKKICDIGEVKGGKRLPKGVSLINENTGFPYIKAGDLKNGTVNIDKIQYVTRELHDKLKRYTVKKGDVYITIVGACIGDVGVVPDSVNGANLTENAARITNLKCDSKYLGMYMASSIAQYQIRTSIASATLGKLSLQNIKAITVPIPSLQEQKEVVRILDSLFESEQQAKELTDILDKIDLMKKAILGRAFRGELGTNDPTEVSAVELLKKALIER